MPVSALRRSGSIARLAAAALFGLGLAACVPAGNPAPAPGPAPGPVIPPGAVAGPSAGNVWNTPPSLYQTSAMRTLATNFGNMTMVIMPGTNMAIGVYTDNTGLTWGQIDTVSGRWQGYWVRTSGVACPLPLPAPNELIAAGFQFNQPLVTWGTFDAQVIGEPFGVNGTWGGCGLPVGGPWTGSAI